MTTSPDRPLPIVRQATAEDADDIHAMVQRFAPRAQRDRGVFDLNLERVLSDPSTWLAVAQCGRVVTGYCLGFDHYTLAAGGRMAWFEEIMVRPVWRRKGIGRALLLSFEAWARARGSRMVAVATREGWPFFEALAYEESAFLFRKPL